MKLITIKRILQIILGGFVIYSINVVIVQYSKFQKKARESEVKLFVKAFETAEDSYYQEWKRFSPIMEDIGFSVRGSLIRTQILVKPEDLHADELKLLVENFPFVQDFAYKVILKYSGGNYTSYWSLDHGGNLVKIVEIPK